MCGEERVQNSCMSMYADRVCLVWMRDMGIELVGGYSTRWLRTIYSYFDCDDMACEVKRVWEDTEQSLVWSEIFGSRWRD